MKLTHIIFHLLLVGSLFSCKEHYQAPTILISMRQEFTNYYEPGTFGIPEVEWKGNTGYFTLKTPEECMECEDAYTLDDQTGEISWDRSLPHAIYTITLTAHNDGGSSESHIRVYNTLRGRFTGQRQDAEGNLLDEDPFTVYIDRFNDRYNIVNHPLYDDKPHTLSYEGKDTYKFLLSEEGRFFVFTVQLVRTDDNLLLVGTWNENADPFNTGKITMIYEQ